MGKKRGVGEGEDFIEEKRRWRIRWLIYKNGADLSV